MPSPTEDIGEVSSTKSVRQTERAKVFVVEATDGSPSSMRCQGDQDIGPDLTREGHFDVSEVEPDPGQSPRANPGFLMQFVHGLRGLLPGCPTVVNCYYLECRSGLYIRTQTLSK